MAILKTSDLYLDDRSALPVYQQLREQILHAVARGRLHRGDRMTAVRELASQLAINPNTVNRAYAELERDGVLRVARGLGTYVTGGGPRDVSVHRTKLAELAERFVAQARALGFDAEQIGRAVAAQLRRARVSRGETR